MLTTCDVDGDRNPILALWQTRSNPTHQGTMSMVAGAVESDRILPNTVREGGL